MRWCYLAIFLVFPLVLVSTVQANSIPAPRIITLAPNLARLVLTAGAGNYLVGVSAWSELPKNIPVQIIGDSEHIDAEKILALKPNLVLAWSGGTPPYIIRQLKNLGLKVVKINTQKLEDIAPALKEIGRLSGTGIIANKAATQFNERLNQLRKSQTHQLSLSVFIDIWDHPLMTVNGTSFMSEAVKVCNGHNIYADNPLPTPLVSIESLISLNPDVIITFSPQSQSIWLNRQFPKAAQAGEIITLNANNFTQATPDIIKEIGLLCKDFDGIRNSAKRTEQKN